SGLAHLLLDQAMIGLQHGVFIPERLTDEPLHRPDLAALHLQGYRFDGFAGEGTELPHHRVEKLVPWFLPGKTRPKGRMEPTEFVHKRGSHVARDSWVSVLYPEGLNSAKSSGTLQRTDRHGIVGQKSSDFQRFL